MDETTPTSPVSPEQPPEPSVRDALVDKAHELMARARLEWERTLETRAEKTRARQERKARARSERESAERARMIEQARRNEQAHLGEQARRNEQARLEDQASQDRARYEQAQLKKGATLGELVALEEQARLSEERAERARMEPASHVDPVEAAEPEPGSKARMRSGLFAKGDAEAWRERLRSGADSIRGGWRRFWQALRPIHPILWRGHIGAAYWTVASTLSLVVNIVLIVLVILLGRQLFFLKNQVVSEQLVNGLYENFVLMDQAHIRTTILVSDTIQVKDTIQVQDTIPVVFDLPLSQKTTVTLTQDTAVNGATIYLNNAPVPLDIVLPQGTQLGIQLDLVVPVKQEIAVVLDVPVDLQVPVSLEVPVDIPLDQTELHKPFVGLQKVVSPFRDLLNELPSAWCEVCKGVLAPVCTTLGFK